MKTTSEHRDSFDVPYQLTEFGLLLFTYAFPLISRYIGTLFPAGFWMCQHKRLTGEPCIFCGTTTSVRRLMLEGILPPTYICIALICLTIEFIRKIFILRRMWKNRPFHATRRFRVIDFALSFALGGIGISGFIVGR